MNFSMEFKLSLFPVICRLIVLKMIGLFYFIFLSNVLKMRRKEKIIRVTKKLNLQNNSSQTENKYENLTKMKLFFSP